jgi:hypothetical protein
MNSDDFENQLQRQPMRPIPSAWRDEILGAARHKCEPRHSTLKPQQVSWWRELLWPCPQAWAGLAAVWMLIFALKVVTLEPAQVVSARPALPVKELQMALQERRRMWVEFAGPTALVEPPKRFVPGPRSERRNEIAAG